MPASALALEGAVVERRDGTWERCPPVTSILGPRRFLGRKPVTADRFAAPESRHRLTRRFEAQYGTQLSGSWPQNPSTRRDAAVRPDRLLVGAEFGDLGVEGVDEATEALLEAGHALAFELGPDVVEVDTDVGE